MKNREFQNLEFIFVRWSLTGRRFDQSFSSDQIQDHSKSFDFIQKYSKTSNSNSFKNNPQRTALNQNDRSFLTSKG